jgi:hypothetical protein
MRSSHYRKEGLLATVAPLTLAASAKAMSAAIDVNL